MENFGRTLIFAGLIESYDWTEDSIYGFKLIILNFQDIEIKCFENTTYFEKKTDHNEFPIKNKKNPYKDFS